MAILLETPGASIALKVQLFVRLCGHSRWVSPLAASHSHSMIPFVVRNFLVAPLLGFYSYRCIGISAGAVRTKTLHST